MDSQDSLAAQKTLLRTRLKGLRAEIPEHRRAKFSYAIACRLFELEQVKTAQSFFIYISHGSEVDTHGIIKRLLATGKLVTVPKIINSDYMVANHFTSWEALRPGKLGILTPITSEPYRGVVDIAVTPGLGFTVEGYRLGFGAGYYDKWFATHVTGLKIALAYEGQIVEYIPRDDHDIPVDMIITEQRTIKTR
jgi:5-formyltetrahydrofolate cyclo-ligase